MAEESRKSRRSLVGVVTSLSGEKSIKVTYFYKVPHPLYGKEIRRKTVIHVHDPISKLKRFRVVKVIEKAPQVASAE